MADKLRAAWPGGALLLILLTMMRPNTILEIRYIVFLMIYEFSLSNFTIFWYPYYFIVVWVHSIQLFYNEIIFYVYPIHKFYHFYFNLSYIIFYISFIVVTYLILIICRLIFGEEVSIYLCQCHVLECWKTNTLAKMRPDEESRYFIYYELREVMYLNIRRTDNKVT